MHLTILLCALSGSLLLLTSLYASLTDSKMNFKTFKILAIVFSLCMLVRFLQCLRQGEDCSKLDSPGGYQGYKNSLLIYICLLIFAQLNV
jgi:hypothetical protein